MRVAVYCRVSTDDQNCDRQQNELMAYADRAGWEVVGTFLEIASGAKCDRAERKQVIELARQRHIDGVLVSELTRWGRSTTDLLATLQELAAYGVSFVNRSRNLLHHEFPEAKKSKDNDTDKVDNIWLFITNEKMNLGKLARWQKKQSNSIGTAKENGFSPELISKARRICQLQPERAEIKTEFEQFLLLPEYQWCVEVFRRYWLSPFEQIILLC